MRKQAIAALLATALLAGCSGGSRSTLPSAPANQNKATTYQVQVDLTKLKGNGAQPKYIAANVKSITVAVVPVDPNSPYPASTTCQNTIIGQTSYLISASAPPGFDVFALYASTNACTTVGPNSFFTPTSTTPVTPPSGGQVIGAISFAANASNIPTAITTADTSVVAQAGPVSQLIQQQLVNTLIGLGVSNTVGGSLSAGSLTTTFALAANTGFTMDRGLFNLAVAAGTNPAAVAGIGGVKEVIPLTLAFAQNGATINSPDPTLTATQPGQAIPLFFGNSGQQTTTVPAAGTGTANNPGPGVTIQVVDRSVANFTPPIPAGNVTSAHHRLFIVNTATGAALSGAAAGKFTYTATAYAPPGNNTPNAQGQFTTTTAACFSGNGTDVLTLICALPANYQVVVTYDGAQQDSYQGAIIRIRDRSSNPAALPGTGNLSVNAQTMANTIFPAPATIANYQQTNGTNLNFFPVNAAGQTVVAGATTTITGVGTPLPNSLGGGIANGGLAVVYGGAGSITSDIVFADSAPAPAAGPFTSVNSVLKSLVTGTASTAPSGNDTNGAAVTGTAANVNFTAVTANGITFAGASPFITTAATTAIYAVDPTCSQCTTAGTNTGSATGIYYTTQALGAPAELGNTAAGGAGTTPFRNTVGAPYPAGPQGIVYCAASANCPGTVGSLFVAANNSIYRVDLAALNQYSSIQLIAGTGVAGPTGTGNSDGAGPTTARFNFGTAQYVGLALGQPTSAAAGPGVLYVSDPGNSSIRQINIAVIGGSVNGTVSTVATNFTNPGGLAVDPFNANLYGTTYGTQAVASLGALYQVTPGATPAAVIFAGGGQTSQSIDGLGLSALPLQFNTGNPFTGTPGTTTVHGSSAAVVNGSVNFLPGNTTTSPLWNDNDLAQNANNFSVASFGNPLGFAYSFDTRYFYVMDTYNKRIRQVQ